MEPNPCTSFRPARAGLAGLALLVGLAGCSGGGGEVPARVVPERTTSAVAAAGAAADTSRPQSPDAAPRDRQLPEPVRRALRRPLEAWTMAWRLALPALNLDQFARATPLSFADEETSFYDGNVEGADLRLTHLVVPSPDVLRVLDPYLDLDLVAERGRIRAERGEEPGARLVDLRQKTERRLAAFAPGARVDGAEWLDASHAVLLVDEPARGGRRPAVYLVDLDRQSVTGYLGPVASREESAAARTELDRRFRAARPELVF